MKPRQIDLTLFDQGYDADTHVLTARGWMRFDAIQDDDRVFVWEDGNLDLEPVAEVYTSPYEGRMFEFSNRHIDLFVMPGTKVIAKKRLYTAAKKGEQFEKTRAEYIKRTWQLEIPVAGVFQGTKTVLPRVAREMGEWCSGLLRDDAEIRINREAVKAFSNLLDVQFEDKTEAEYRRAMKQIAKQHADRELSWDMLLWNYEARKQFLTGFFEGRGRQYPPATVCLFLVTKEGASDILQAMTMSMGWRSQISHGNGVFFSPIKSTSSVFYKHRKLSEDPWKGVVWNLKTETGTMVVRRDRKISIASTL